jgi:hypothetical protein
MPLLCSGWGVEVLEDCGIGVLGELGYWGVGVGSLLDLNISLAFRMGIAPVIRPEGPRKLSPGFGCVMFRSVVVLRPRPLFGWSERNSRHLLSLGILLPSWQTASIPNRRGRTGGGWDNAKQIPGFSLGFSFCRRPLPGYQIKIDIIGAVGCAGLQFDGQTTVS